MSRRTGARRLGAALFTDIVGSTVIAGEMGNARWGELVTRHHRVLRREIDRFAGREVDTAGDGFFATFERPADAIKCAVAAVEAVRALGVEIRAGVGFGELEVVNGKPGGLVVNTAARVMSQAQAGEVLVPASVKDLVLGSGITFEDHGIHELKGLEAQFRLLRVVAVDGRVLSSPLDADRATELRREILPASKTRRGALMVGLAASALAATALAVVLLSGGRSGLRGAGAGHHEHSVLELDAMAGTRRSVIPLGRSIRESGLHPIAAGVGGVWVLQSPNLLHIDPLRDEVRNETINVDASQSVETGFDSVWTMTERGERGLLLQVLPATDTTREGLLLPPTPGISTYGMAIADAVWIGISDGTLLRFDPRTGARDQADTGVSMTAVAATSEAVWLFDTLAGTLTRIDPLSLRKVGSPIPFGGNVDSMGARADHVWILDRAVGLVTRVDASSGAQPSARVGKEPTDMAVGDDAIWVGDRSGSVYRIDSLTLKVTRFWIGAEVFGVALDPAEESVWVLVGEATRA